MGFFDTIGNLAKAAGSWLFGGNSGSGGGNLGLISQLAKTAMTGYSLYKLNKSIKKENETGSQPATQAPTVDSGQTIVVTPDQTNRIPVLYGEAFVPSIITDAQLSSNRQTMTYVFTICEKTGTKISDNLATNYLWEDVYINDQRVVFKSDGITVDYTVDREGNQDISLRDLVTIRLYLGGSTSSFQTQQNGSFAIVPVDAWTVVPNWNSSFQMNDLIFSVMTVKYDKTKGLTGVPRLLFHIISDMDQPGDVLYDYATNTRYGAGIAPEDIYRE